MKKREYYYQSKISSKILYGISFVPDKKDIKGYIQLVHDMYDCIDRYERILSYFAEQGYVAFGADMIGHGKSVENGFFGNMLDYRPNDLSFELNEFYNMIIKDNTPDFSPIEIDVNEKTRKFVKPQVHCMIGIGFGCSLIRNYCYHYKNVNCVVFVGDMGFEAKRTKLLQECEKNCKKYGEEESSENIRRMLHNSNQLDSKEEKTYRNSFRLMKNRSIKELNSKEDLNFEYTNKSMKLILMVLNQFSLDQWVNVFPNYLPLYEISGYLDPLNNYTRGLDEILNRFRYSSMKNIFYKYYDDSKHDVLFESCSKFVCQDISYFVDRVRIGIMEFYEKEKLKLEREEMRKDIC